MTSDERVRNSLCQVVCELITYDVYIRTGYPELGLPVFDPLRLQKLDIEQGENFFFLVDFNRS